MRSANGLRLRRALLALLLLTGPLPAAAQATTASQAAADEESARRAKAVELAQLVEPREVLVDPAVLEAQIVDALLADHEMKELEDAYPGLIRAMWRGAAPELESQVVKSLPAHWNRLAATYADNMTIQEIEAARSFFSSDVGRKLVKLKNEAMVGPVSQLASRPDTAAVTQETLDAGNTAAAQAMEQAFTPNEQLLAAAFVLSPAGQKLKAITPEIQRISLEWMNESDPEGDARIEALMAEALETHIAAAEAKQSTP